MRGEGGVGSKGGRGVMKGESDDRERVMTGRGSEWRGEGMEWNGGGSGVV